MFIHHAILRNRKEFAKHLTSLISENYSLKEIEEDFDIEFFNKNSETDFRELEDSCNNIPKEYPCFMIYIKEYEEISVRSVKYLYKSMFND